MAASSKPHQWTYDVFVSFRGEDIRKSFVDHLFDDFEHKRIRAFRDDNELPKGEEISTKLYKAIEQSRLLIVIFSKNFAYSSWCLRELVKILECKEMEEPKYEVRVIFYDVKPDVVRKQTQSYAKAFGKHVSLNKTEVAKWREALSKAADLSGWDLHDLTNGYEAKFIDIISKEIFNKSWEGPLHVGEKLVGVDAHVEELNLLRFVRSNKVHMFGICGISGLGKTTLAKALYNSMYTYFKGSCFCDDVEGVAQQQGLTQVQMQLINNIMKIRDVKIWTSGEGSMIIKKKVASKPILLVLDNVNNREQVKALAGSPDWFFPGSLIIFTSKEKQLLRSYDVEIYDMPFLPFHESCELFCLHAFGQKYPANGLSELAYQVVEHLQGHPLALEVIGGCLREKPVNVWRSELDRIQTYANVEIQQRLRPSYDGLDFDQKRIFLDIASSLLGENTKIVANILYSHNCSAHATIEVLVDNSLVKLSPHDVSLQMHELIHGMAREIEREESNMLGKQRRLWGASEDIYLILSENKGTEAIEVINLCSQISSQKYDINTEAFENMKKLRILKLPKNPNVNFFGRLRYLSNNLMYLYWHGYPFKFLPLNFYPENIVVIDLSYSHIKMLWTTPKCFTRLEILKLSHCRNLTNSPDFTNVKNLKELILEGCESLIKVHPSIGMLKSLVVLNMKNCKRLESFPCKLEMDSLKVLNLSGCLRLNNVHEALGRIKRQLELHIDRIAITRLSSFVFSFINLIGVSSFGQHRSRWWSTISQPSCLPQSLVLSSLPSLPLLQALDISNCNILQVPENIGSLSCLKELDLSGNNFTTLPRSLSQLTRVTRLRIDGCKKLEVFPELPPSIQNIDASDCNISQVHENIGGLSCLEKLRLSENSFTSLPKSLSQLSRLTRLTIDGCKKLEVFPDLPPGIQNVDASYCNISQVPEDIGGLSCLEQLDLSGNSFASLPQSLRKLSRFKKLRIDDCEKLEVLPELPQRICSIYASSCPKLFRNLTVECLEPQPWDTSITSHETRDKLTSLVRYMDIQSNIFEFFNKQAKSTYWEEKMEMTFHGDRIPQWFPNQSIGSNIKIEIPPDWCYSKFKGYAICVVFTPKKLVGTGSIKVSVNNFDGAYLNDPTYYRVNYDSTMIWLHYVKRNRRWVDAKKFITFSVTDDGDVEVKMFGVRLVFDEDIQQDTDSSMTCYLPITTQYGGEFRRSVFPYYTYIKW